MFFNISSLPSTITHLSLESVEINASLPPNLTHLQVSEISRDFPSSSLMSNEQDTSSWFFNSPSSVPTNLQYLIFFSDLDTRLGFLPPHLYIFILEYTVILFLLSHLLLLIWYLLTMMETGEDQALLYGFKELFLAIFTILASNKCCSLCSSIFFLLRRFQYSGSPSHRYSHQSTTFTCFANSNFFSSSFFITPHTGF